MQPLIDKIGARLPGWKGKFLSSSGKEILVKTVLSSLPIYHLTVFHAHKWLIKRIDRIRRSFLWRGESPDKVSGGHSLINWPTTCLPKTKGGLGILELERFTRALRLRWLWFKWKQKQRAWNDLEIPCDKVDRELFEKTRRKNITVRQALNNNKWIDHIYPPTSPEEVRQFVRLWEELQGVVLNVEIQDDISWRWTADGVYTTQSAYQIQFVGVYSRMKITPIWRAKAEHKCRFFAWTLMHKKILTANNFLKRGWTEDTECKLCDNDLETPTHLCKDCPFTKEVWGFIKHWFNLSVLQTVSEGGSIYSFWLRCRRKFDKNQRKEVDGILIYFWWNIWKERNRRIFQQHSLQPIQVASLCKDDITQYGLAMVSQDQRTQSD